MDKIKGKSVPMRDLITLEQYCNILEYHAVVGTSISIVGLMSNIINIKTFLAMALKDGVTVSFLALSVIDLWYLVFSISLGVTVSLGVVELKHTATFQLDPVFFTVMFANVTILINVTNILTTTFIAVARCMCVAKPLQFKNTFTRMRTAAFIGGFTVFALAMYTPVIANTGLRPLFDKRVNMTRPTLWMSQIKEKIKVISWLIIDMILPFATQVIVLVCIGVMTNSLRAASKFRQSSVLTSEFNDTSREKSAPAGNVKVDSSNSGVGNSGKLTGKELRVVQQVVLISLIYIICNIPKIIICIVATIETDFAIGKRYNNIYRGANILRQTFHILNSSVNTIIYFRYNTKFRATLLHK